MFRSDNPIRDFERYDAEQQRKLDRLPKCAYCGEPIQDEKCYRINGDLVHTDCAEEYLDKNCEVSTDSYTD